MTFFFTRIYVLAWNALIRKLSLHNACVQKSPSIGARTIWEFYLRWKGVIRSNLSRHIIEMAGAAYGTFIFK